MYLQENWAMKIIWYLVTLSQSTAQHNALLVFVQGYTPKQKN